MEIISGIYKIENKINHHIYIGQSVHIYSRWKYHKYEGHWINNYLYNAFKKYGIENFDFSIIEIVPPNKDILNEREKYWIKYYDSYNNGYNLTEGGDSSTVKKILTEDEIKDIRKRKMLIQSPRDVYQDYKDKISWALFDKIWNGILYSNIMAEIYEDKEKLKFIEHILKQRMNLIKSPLTIDIILDIREMTKNKKSRAEIINKYKNISPNTLDGIRYLKYYPELTLDNKEYIKFLTGDLVEDYED